MRTGTSRWQTARSGWTLLDPNLKGLVVSCALLVAATAYELARAGSGSLSLHPLDAPFAFTARWIWVALGGAAGRLLFVALRVLGDLPPVVDAPIDGQRVVLSGVLDLDAGDHVIIRTSGHVALPSAGARLVVAGGTVHLPPRLRVVGPADFPPLASGAPVWIAAHFIPSPHGPFRSATVARIDERHPIVFGPGTGGDRRHAVVAWASDLLRLPLQLTIAAAIAALLTIL